MYFERIRQSDHILLIHQHALADSLILQKIDSQIPVSLSENKLIKSAVFELGKLCSLTKLVCAGLTAKSHPFPGQIRAYSFWMKGSVGLNSVDNAP